MVCVEELPCRLITKKEERDHGASAAYCLEILSRAEEGRRVRAHQGVTRAVIGIAASLALTRVLTKSLFEVTPNDPATLATVVAAILLVALAAGYLPARRASHVEVLTALPQECEDPGNAGFSCFDVPTFDFAA